MGERSSVAPAVKGIEFALTQRPLRPNWVLAPRPVPKSPDASSRDEETIDEAAHSGRLQGTALRVETTEPFRSTEVLCCTGQQLDLQALWGKHGELDSGPEVARRCSPMLATTTELAIFAGTS
jgi:hypothetical protein